MRTTRERHQESSRRCLVQQEPEQLQGRGVRPVQVFQDKEDRVMFGNLQEDGDNSFQRLLALPLGRNSERCILRLWERQRE